MLSLGLGLTVLVAIAQIEGNLTRQMQESLPADAPALFFLDIQPDQTAEFDALAAAVEGVRAVDRVPMLRGRITAINGTPPSQLEIPREIAWIFSGDRGLTWTRTPPANAELAAGQWWPEDYDGPPLVSFDAEVAEALDLAPGDRLTVNVLGRGFDVEIANLRVIDWTNLGINFVMVFSPDLLEAAPQTHIATLKGTPEAEVAAEQAVTERFANVTAIRVREALEAVAELIGHMAAAVRLTAAVGLVTGILVLAGAVAAGHERRDLRCGGPQGPGGDPLDPGPRLPRRIRPARSRHRGHRGGHRQPRRLLRADGFDGAHLRLPAGRRIWDGGPGPRPDPGPRLRRHLAGALPESRPTPQERMIYQLIRVNLGIPSRPIRVDLSAKKANMKGAISTA